MQQTMERIADILEEELAIYEELVEISRRLTDVIINGEIEELDEILNMQQTMIMSLGRLEEERAGAASELWRDDLVMTEIIEKAEGDLADRLEKLFEDLLDVVEEQKRLNDINSKLIKTNLEYVEFTLGTLTGNKPVHLFDEKA